MCYGVRRDLVMRVLVTGGNGFIGSVVVGVLTSRGYEVRCLLRDGSRTDRIDRYPIERARGDVRDGASVLAAMRGCDAVAHLAGLSSWKDIRSPLLSAVVVGGTANVIDAATALGGLRTVFVSSSVTIGGSRQPAVHDERGVGSVDLCAYPYVQSKRAAEALCAKAAAKGVPVVIVNPAEVYGPNDTSLVTAGTLVGFARSPVVLVPRGGTSIVHVDDVAAGVVAALEKGRPGERYILAGENLTIRQLAGLTLRILGRKTPIWRVPNALLRLAAKMGDALRLPLPFDPAVVPYATLYWFLDNGKARDELGLTFRGAAETLTPTLGWLREAGYV
jgi:dihydroflavonol-4-reductase